MSANEKNEDKNSKINPDSQETFVQPEPDDISPTDLDSVAGGVASLACQKATGVQEYTLSNTCRPLKLP